MIFTLINWLLSYMLSIYKKNIELMIIHFRYMINRLNSILVQNHSSQRLTLMKRYKSNIGYEM